MLEVYRRKTSLINLLGRLDRVSHAGGEVCQYRLENAVMNVDTVLLGIARLVEGISLAARIRQIYSPGGQVNLPNIETAEESLSLEQELAMSAVSRFRQTTSGVPIYFLVPLIPPVSILPELLKP